jgi:hypothetical protein
VAIVGFSDWLLECQEVVGRAIRLLKCAINRPIVTYRPPMIHHPMADEFNDSVLPRIHWALDAGQFGGLHSLAPLLMVR